MIKPLLEFIREHNMISALPHGIPTYETIMSNWTSPGNVWHKLNNTDPVVICDVYPNIRPPLADHLPIYTKLNLPISRANTFPSQNIQNANLLLLTHCPAKRIWSKDKLENTANTLIETIQEVLNQEVPTTQTMSLHEEMVNKGINWVKKGKEQAK